MQKRQKITFNIIFILLSLVGTLFLTPYKFEYFKEDSNFVLSILALVNVVVFLTTTRKFFSSWIRYDTLFLLGFLIVHFQIPFLASIGVEPEVPSYTWINKIVVN